MRKQLLAIKKRKKEEGSGNKSHYPFNNKMILV